jgi:hypothetical protein
MVALKMAEEAPTRHAVDRRAPQDQHRVPHPHRDVVAARRGRRSRGGGGGVPGLGRQVQEPDVPQQVPAVCLRLPPRPPIRGNREGICSTCTRRLEKRAGVEVG